MTYRERLYIPWWWVVIALLFWLSLAVAVLAYIPAGPAIAFSVLAAVGMGLALVAYSLTLVGVDGLVMDGIEVSLAEVTLVSDGVSVFSSSGAEWEARVS